MNASALSTRPTRSGQRASSKWALRRTVQPVARNAQPTPIGARPVAQILMRWWKRRGTRVSRALLQRRRLPMMAGARYVAPNNQRPRIMWLPITAGSRSSATEAGCTAPTRTPERLRLALLVWHWWSVTECHRPTSRNMPRRTLHAPSLASSTVRRQPELVPQSCRQQRLPRPRS